MTGSTSAFEAQAGLRVVAHGRIDLFEPQGALQLYVDSLQPAGVGDLALRFEALKAKLAEEGLFDGARKRPLPVRPRVIAVVTSPDRGRLARHLPRPRAALAADPGDAGRVQGAGRGRPGEHRQRPDPGGALDRRVRGGGSARGRSRGDDRRARRRLARGPVGLQRRAGGPGGRGASGAGGGRDRARGGRDADRLRGRRPGAHAVRGRGTGRAGSGGPARGDRRWAATAGCRGHAPGRGRRTDDGGGAPGAGAPPPGGPTGGGTGADRAARGSGDADRSRRGWTGSGAPWSAPGARLEPTLPARLSRDRARLARADGLAGWPRDGWPGLGPAWTPPPRPWRSSGRRPRSTAATRSSGAHPTARSCERPRRRRRGRASRSGSPGASCRPPRGRGHRAGEDDGAS